MKKKSTGARGSTGGKLALPAIFLLVLLGLVFFGILPAARKIDETQAAIAKLEADHHQQKALLPVAALLEQRKNETLPEGIAVNEIKPLTVDDLTNLPEVFETLARDSKVELVSVTPQVRSLRGEREVLRVDTLVRGEYLTFNVLLNQLNKMRFVENIESLAINVTDLGPEMNFSAWLAIQ